MTNELWDNWYYFCEVQNIGHSITDAFRLLIKKNKTNLLSLHYTGKIDELDSKQDLQKSGPQPISNV